MTSSVPDCTPEAMAERIAHAERLWLFLDYDGTLAEFAPTPDHVFPDDQVVDLVTRLARHPRIRVSVVSGRRLAHVRKLLPVPGILLAGTYGVEMQLPNGQELHRVSFDQVRPVLDAVKPGWAGLIDGREGYFLEDKRWALAIHGRHAKDGQADSVLEAGREIAEEALRDVEPGLFRLLGGYKFLEIGPTLAHKGKTVAYLLDQRPLAGALPLYLGDDDKDEEAFGVLHQHGGLAIVVTRTPRESLADCRLESPKAVHRWLEDLLQGMAGGSG